MLRNSERDAGTFFAWRWKILRVTQKKVRSKKKLQAFRKKKKKSRDDGKFWEWHVTLENVLRDKKSKNLQQNVGRFSSAKIKKRDAVKF